MLYTPTASRRPRPHPPLPSGWEGPGYEASIQQEEYATCNTLSAAPTLVLTEQAQTLAEFVRSSARGQRQETAPS